MVEKLEVAAALAIASLLWMNPSSGFLAIAQAQLSEESRPVESTNVVLAQRSCPQECQTWTSLQTIRFSSNRYAKH